MPKISVRDLNLRDQRVLVRVDYNVPLVNEGGKMVIADDTRIRETLPTLDYLHEQGAKVILMAHLGRPKGKRNAEESLRPVAERLSELLVRPVAFVDDCIGDKVEKTVGLLKAGDTLLLENVRFYAQEEKNDPAFAQSLAKLADIYVNDAFGAAHRAHASTEGVARLVKTKAIGLLMEKELEFLHEKLQSPARPFVVILGGAKVSDKIDVINALTRKADVILIGGAMAYTFALAQGKKIGSSLSEPDKVDVARQTLETAKKANVKILLPLDNVIAEKIDFKGRSVSPLRSTAADEDIPEGWSGVDIGPQTIQLFSGEIAKAKTIVWNGPMGVFEIKSCATGTFAVANAVAANKSAVSIVGGGDSVKAIHASGNADKVSFISTGGGASLELLEGKVLPGVAAIPDKT